MNSSDPEPPCLWIPGLVNSNGILAGDTPFDFFFPRLAFQMIIASCMSLIMQHLLKPLGQTRYISSLIGGMLLGPSFLGGIAPEVVQKYVFPKEGVQLLDLGCRFGLCFWHFLMGAQIHVGPMMKNVSRKAVWIGMTAMIAPFLFAFPTSFAVNMFLPDRMQSNVLPIFMGLHFVTTTLTVLAGNVVDHKLLGTEMGNLAMSSAIFTAVAAIVPLQIMVWCIPPHGKPYNPQWKLPSGAMYIVFIFFVARPILHWIARRVPNEEDVKEYHVSAVMLWAVVGASLTEILGAHTTCGAFFAGLILPHSALTTVVTSRLEDFNSTVLMPLFFIMIGQQVNLLNMFENSKGWFFVLMLLIVYLGKVSFIAFVASWYSVPINEGLSIGFLMCSRGILDILQLSWATLAKLNNADEQEFAIMLFGIMMTNLIIGPAISFLYDHPLLLRHKGSRAIQELKPDAEFRILGCIYDHHTIPSLLNLVKSSHATRFSPINLSVLHLVHATSRDSTYSWAEDYEAVEDECRFPVHEVPKYEKHTRHYIMQQEQPMAQGAQLRARRNNATRQNGIQFDEYGWNWNLGAGF
ncbi:K(+)/H(+) antiporter 1 [Nymphaea thermarum]|nr:K(+)/H(+) antiporter 1 [Nymphaea thermarum]